MKNLLLVTATTLVFPLFAMAQTSGSMSVGTGSTMSAPAGSGSMSSTPEKLSMLDSHFIKMASISGLAEVSDGKLAETMGSASVKAIGTQMVIDHGKANDELTTIATADGATPPTEVDAMHAETNARLKTLSGSTFDKEYLQTELLGHEKTIALFKEEASFGSAKNLKSFAATTLPTLEQHLSMIKVAIK